MSPSNILISSHGDVKLVDFGVAKAAGRLIVSREHSVKGKPTYMAPEQARGGVTTRSDLFSVGAVLYEMITGKRLRPSGNLDTIRGFPGVSDPLSAQRADTPLVLDRLVRRCLAREPSDRPASARELRQELGQVLRRLVSPGFEGHERMARFVATDLAGQDGLGDVFRAMRGQLEELTATARPAPLPPATAPQGPEVDGVVLLPRSTSVSPPPTPMAAPVRWRRVALAALLLLGLVLGVAVTASLRGSASLEGIAPPLPDSGDPAFGRIAEQVRPTAAAEPTSSLDEGRRSAGTGAASMPVRNVDAGHTDPGPRQLGNKPRRRVKPERPRTTKTQRSPTKAQRPRAKAQRPRAKTQRPRAAAGQPDADAGRLYLNSRPWTIVEIDGKYVGETPIEGISIAPGTHRVYLYNRHEGVAHTLWLRVRAKQVVRRVLTLP